MTLGSIFGTVLGPSSPLFPGPPAGGPPHKFLSERNSHYYHHGSKHHKSKSDKKHAILSALTLLAFLFFLSILQSCIREQTYNRGTVVMMAPTGGTAPTGHQAKEPEERTKRSVDAFPKNTNNTRKSRMLLSLEEPPTGNRQVKFIRNLSTGNNWTRELSQITEKELQDQKVKTMNLYWKNRVHPNRTGQQILRRFKKRERTSSSTESGGHQVETNWDYKKPDKFRPSPYIPDTTTNNSHSTWQTRQPTAVTINTPTVSNPVSTTPRNRRSDYSTRPTDYDDYGSYTEPNRDDAHSAPTSPVGLDLNTFQTFPVHNYYNHRPAPIRDNQSETPAPDIDRMHTQVQTLTTQPPLFHPTRTSPQHHHHRHRHPPHYHVRNHYPDTTYRFSPYRKTTPYDPPHFHDHHHDDYYPPLVLAKYEVQHDDPGFDLIRFLWTMFTSFAKPLTKLVPSFAKDNHEEAQCYDLLVCEAQRASRLMGPTAEALATTVGTLLTWAASEDSRQMVMEAINSGRENTCQQQIRDCEERSGGKSAMTVIAQVMEMKLR